MKRIKVFDTTLRDGEQSPGCLLYTSVKILCPQKRALKYVPLGGFLYSVVQRQPNRNLFCGGHPEMCIRDSRGDGGVIPGAYAGIGSALPSDFDCSDVFRSGWWAHSDFCGSVQNTDRRSQAAPGENYRWMKRLKDANGRDQEEP